MGAGDLLIQGRDLRQLVTPGIGLYSGACAISQVPPVGGIAYESVPERLRLKHALKVPPALTEMELSRHLQELAALNQSAADPKDQWT